MRVRARRRLARCTAALTLVLLVLVPASTDAAAPPQPGTGGFYTNDDTERLEGTQPLGLFPSGMNVWVLDGTPHVERIARAVSYAVSQLRRYGLDVTYQGVAQDEDVAKGTGYLGVYGSITVDEAQHQNGPRCAKVNGAPEGTIAEGVTYPGSELVAGIEQLDLSAVTLCPDVFTRGADVFTSAVLHEMGHAVGLGHFRGSYDGRDQIMNPVISHRTRYQHGDVNGLRYIAAQDARIEQASRLQGVVESWDVAAGSMAVRGWAVTGRARETTAVRVTLDGRLRAGVLTTRERPGIAARFPGTWPRPGFEVQVDPLRPGRHRYCVLALSVLVPDRQRTLGCRDVSYHPPRPPPRATPVQPTTVQPTTVVPRRAAAGTSPHTTVLAPALVLAALVLVAGGFIGYTRRRLP